MLQGVLEGSVEGSRVCISQREDKVHMLNKQKARIGTLLLAAVAVSLLVLAPGAPAARA